MRPRTLPTDDVRVIAAREKLQVIKARVGTWRRVSEDWFAGRAAPGTLCRLAKSSDEHPFRPAIDLVNMVLDCEMPPIRETVTACPTHGVVHVADCHGQPGAPAWRKPRHRCTSIHDDWLERYRERTPATEQGPMSEDIDELYVPWDMVYSSSDLRQAIAHARDKLARARKESPSWPVEAREVEGFLSGFLRGSPATAQVNTRPGMAATFGLVLEE